MTETRKPYLPVILTLVLVALNLVAFNILISGWSSARIDLTWDRLYSSSEATRLLLSSLDDDVLIHGYFSERTHPKLAPLIPPIRDMLNEYEAMANGMVKVEIVDPSVDAEAEKEANDRFGVESTPFELASKYETGIVNAYFALVIRHGDRYVRYGFSDLIEIDPLPDGDIDVRLRNLEYDLTRAIKKVVFGFRGGSELFDRVEQPLRFTAVMTPASMPELFEEIPEAVRTAAAELQDKGGDRFVYEEIDPSRSEEERIEAMERYGVQPMALGLFGGEQFYLYGFLESGGRVEQLALAAEGVSAAAIREAIEEFLRRQTPGFLKTIGISAPQPSIPPEILAQLRMQGRMPQQPPPEFEQLKIFLRQDYEVVDVSLDSPDGVPAEIDTLLVLKPLRLSRREVYSLDQYLMRGGKVVICAGNYEIGFTQTGLDLRLLVTGIDDWLEHHGVEIPATLVMDDRNQPLAIPEIRMTSMGAIRTWRMAPYPYLVEVGDDGIRNREIAGNLGAIALYWGSPVTVDPEKTGELEVTELLVSSERSWTSDDTSRAAEIGYQVPDEGLERSVLATVLSGRFRSYFAGQEPPALDDGIPEDGKTLQPPGGVPLQESPETRLAVIGNAEFLNDFVARQLGTSDSGFFVENLAFMQNLIDWLNLDNDLVSIRSRSSGPRRLVRVSSGTEIVVEAINYTVPLVTLLALAGYRLWRRRNTSPLVQAGGAQEGRERA